jgi:mandelate racemase
MNPLLVEPLDIANGLAVASDRPGVGLEWNREAVARYAMRGVRHLLRPTS